MRIAVSGTHCSGKSTLVDDFLAAHPDYAHEPEPYEWLTELYGEELPDAPSIGDFYRQLEVCVERLRGHDPGARVIAERSPLDFLAYMLAIADLRRDRVSADLRASAVELAARGMKHVDLLAVLSPNGIAAPDAEDPELREAMNERLLELVAIDELDLLSGVRVIELHGSPRRRLQALEAVIAGDQ